jgi:hypothetical protein
VGCQSYASAALPREIFRKSFEKVQISLKSDNNKEYFTRIYIPYLFFNHTFYEIMWKKCFRARQATDDNMVHAHCMLDAYGCKDTLMLFNIYCFSNAALVACKRLNISL